MRGSEHPALTAVLINRRWELHWLPVGHIFLLVHKVYKAACACVGRVIAMSSSISCAISGTREHLSSRNTRCAGCVRLCCLGSPLHAWGAMSTSQGGLQAGTMCVDEGPAPSAFLHMYLCKLAFHSFQRVSKGSAPLNAG